MCYINKLENKKQIQEMLRRRLLYYIEAEYVPEADEHETLVRKRQRDGSAI